MAIACSPVHDEQGSIAGMHCVCVDTASEVLAERHRAQEIDRMRGLFRQAPGCTAVVREPGHVFEVANDAFMNLIGQRDMIRFRVSAHPQQPRHRVWRLYPAK
ncbi:hypothetical protein [Janthinobacterium psychrotolerans]|uniref:hypothetical protein n=1 Tax=Janthinobacterium psychrotolerans TaxID=1747903 RepID=UPI0012375A3D|nr:hypothetical protein [Janthinobacterium psychrotolerans]